MVCYRPPPPTEGQLQAHAIEHQHGVFGQLPRGQSQKARLRRSSMGKVTGGEQSVTHPHGRVGTAQAAVQDWVRKGRQGRGVDSGWVGGGEACQARD
jgi:hypothetical protein